MVLAVMSVVRFRQLRCGRIVGEHGGLPICVVFDGTETPDDMIIWLVFQMSNEFPVAIIPAATNLSR